MLHVVKNPTKQISCGCNNQSSQCACPKDELRKGRNDFKKMKCYTSLEPKNGKPQMNGLSKYAGNCSFHLHFLAISEQSATNHFTCPYKKIRS